MDVPWTILKWMKLNLMQRQQAFFYCSKWEVTPLSGFGDFDGLRLLRDLEDFFLDIMGYRPPTKHMQRRVLRKRYRLFTDNKMADSECETDAVMRHLNELGWAHPPMIISDAEYLESLRKKKGQRKFLSSK